ncbi:MAG TPA: 2Fe-2S iron-sulfur cluster-binding protein [Lacipirellulaceae bacterium]|nr:2Fe-2S iron-sulfur cluster-binding protein [Lacipirellulaceae bacterium]
MHTALINNVPLELDPSEQINCIQAAHRIGFEVPHYCWHPALSVVASCRMCLVEVGERKPDGSIVMRPKLEPGCQTPVKDGMVIVADSPKVKAAQQATLEYLLLNHPLDCPTCDQAGECFLQDYSFQYGRGFSRLQEPKNLKPDKDHIGDQITLFTDRCIMCTRCVRFTREFSGTGELMVTQGGTHEEIDIFPGEPCNNKLAGNVVDLCPVGALCSKDFLYKQRVWWLKSVNSVCPNCSTGCSVHVDQNEDRVYRLTPRVNPQAQGHFMCDDGRFGWKYLHSDQRLTFPEHREGSRIISRGWDDILPALREALKKRAAAQPKKFGVVLSPWMTVEEAYLLVSYLRSVTPYVQVAVGRARVEGDDDQYPKDVHGNAVEPVRFTIRAEKAPNLRGVTAVAKHFADKPLTFQDMLNQAGDGLLDVLYLVGGDPAPWISDDEAARLERVPLLVVQDLLESPVSRRATFVLSGGSFAERDGTFVNHAGLAQEIRRAVRGPDGSRPDNRILWDLAGRTGLYQGAALREEIAAAIPELAALAAGKLGDHGVLLSTTEQPAAVAN